MKSVFFIVFGILSLTSLSQVSYRYFEFSSSYCPGGWQDTSFIAATSDQNVINAFLAELKKPQHLRKFIAGPITYGNGGYNHNASHWFKWSFIPDKWSLTDIATEYCDGCPSFVDADTAYWVGHVGFFCPNSANPSREISDPTGYSEVKPSKHLNFYPNPVTDHLYLKENTTLSAPVQLEIYNALGILVHEAQLDDYSSGIDLGFLTDGMYFLSIASDLNITTSRIIKKSN